MPIASKSPFHDNGSSEAAVVSMYLSGNNGTCYRESLAPIKRTVGLQSFVRCHTSSADRKSSVKTVWEMKVGEVPACQSCWAALHW